MNLDFLNPALAAQYPMFHNLVLIAMVVSFFTAVITAYNAAVAGQDPPPSWGRTLFLWLPLTYNVLAAGWAWWLVPVLGLVAAFGMSAVGILIANLTGNTPEIRRTRALLGAIRSANTAQARHRQNRTME